MVPKSNQHGIINLIHVFCLFFHWFLQLCWSPFGPKMEPWRPKGSPKVAKGRPRGPLVSFFFNRLAPGTILGGFGEVLGMIWGGFGEGFGTIWEGFLQIKIKGEPKGTKEN